MADKKNELAKQEAAPLAELSELDQLLGQHAGAGVENVTQDDILLPRLLLLQPTSPLATEDPFRPGYFANSISKDSFGSKADFYIVHYYPSRVRWETDEIGGPIDCTSSDNLNGTQTDAAHGYGVCHKCPFSQWSKGNDGSQNPPDCTEFKNLILIPADNLDSVPLLFSAKRTGLKSVMELLSAVKYSKQPIFANRYTLESVKSENAKGTFYTPKFSRGAKIDSLENLKALIKMNTELKAAQDRIVGPQNDDLEGDAAPAEGDAF